MRILKQLLDFYINASIHVALAVYALSWITLIEFGIAYDESVLYFNFFATISGYNFIKYFGLAKFHHRSLANWLKVIQVFSFFCFLLLCYYTFHLEFITWLYILSMGLITFFYAIPFLPRNVFVDKNQNLRQISGLKIYVIAFVWSVVTVILPTVNNEYTLHMDVFVTFFQRFVFILVLMIPFEIRDLRYDSIKLSTIPQRIGIRKTKLIGIGLLVLFFLSEFMKDHTSQVHLFVLGMVMVITLLFVILSKEDQNKYYSALWVEGIPVFWLLLILFYGLS